MAKTITAVAGAFFGAALVVGAAGAEAATFTVEQIFDEPTPDGLSAAFGASVALDGGRALIGAPGDGTNGQSAGQAHLFDAGTGQLLQTFDDPTPAAGDSFGESVALDGNRVVIGLPSDDGAGINVGQAQLFNANTGQLLQTFNDPTPTDGDRFGSTVAVDGSRVLIGANRDDTNGEDVGQAHLFDANTGQLLRTFNDPTPNPAGEGDRFGDAVALDGNRALIGATFGGDGDEEFGQAHLFDINTGELLQTFNDPTPTAFDLFGDAVAIDGDRVLIGASGDRTDLNPTARRSGQAHLFDANTGQLLRTFENPRVEDQGLFGTSVAIDGDRVVIGASSAGPRSNGLVYRFDASTGELLQTLVDPVDNAGDRFGSSVAIEGESILIGARSDDASLGGGRAFRFPVAEGINTSVRPVPVPATLAFLAAGLVGLALARRRPS